ncbi:hypothetical protein [Neoroseomonas lacus]|uniref:Uncharacterized protein n=1 Tax=Neoroseomonas lacus TaxID=287609 RepID=A0A917NUN3_9PROT|nr:hypothetical protein [Neoroseomonas lacus]GGJ31644.1 hypothetical protein GCM10011320_43840 [Neoroseomonas lacus]
MSGSTKTRAPAKPRTAGTPRAPRAKAKKPISRWAALGPATRRWIFIGGFTLGLLVGLPLVHALMGEVAAILIGTFIFGFVVGRMTQKR